MENNKEDKTQEILDALFKEDNRIPLHLPRNGLNSEQAATAYNHFLKMMALNPRGFRTPPKNYEPTGKYYIERLALKAIG